MCSSQEAKKKAEEEKQEIITTWLVDPEMPSKSWAPRQLTLPHKKVSEDEQYKMIKAMWKDEVKANETVELHVVEPSVDAYPGPPSLHVLVERNPLESHEERAAVLLEVKNRKSDVVHWRTRFVANPASFTSLSAETKSITHASKITLFDDEINDKEPEHLWPGDHLHINSQERHVGRASSLPGQDKKFTGKTDGWTVSKDSPGRIVPRCPLVAT